ncbi:MAG: hypothetical protein JW716_04270 [Candidatus Aenigmarchaeota archaeon]|nr:hypothetical protein [Candidatus Aenigmarchaeota archaeon]
MDIMQTLSTISGQVTGLSVGNAVTILEPLIMFAIGMIIYSVFIFKFYRFIAKREVFKIKIREGDSHKGLKKLLLVLEYVFLFPIVAFMWFIGFTAMMTVLSKVVSIDNIFLIAMAVLTSIRVTAYYDEDLSKDVAKLLPFALMGVFLLDIAGVSYTFFFQMLFTLPEMTGTLIYYFLFIVVLELLLRFALFLRGGGDRKK